MQFNATALLVLVAFCALLMFALSAGSAARHGAEAIVTVIILIGVGGYALRGNTRSR